MKLLVALPLVASTASATFTLTSPPSIGTNLSTQSYPPCGGFDVTDESTFVEWRLDGHDIKLTDVFSMYGSSKFSFIAAKFLASGDLGMVYTESWPSLRTSDQGTLCFPRMEGKRWEVHGVVVDDVPGKAILSVEQDVGNGVKFYQCAAVMFVPGPQEVFDC